MTSTTPESRAILAYTAYGRCLQFTDFMGDPLPTWADLPGPVQATWIDAAHTVWTAASLRASTLSNEARARLIYLRFGGRIAGSGWPDPQRPTWNALAPRLQEAWTAAVQVVWTLGTTGQAVL
jgi:hypothetical protein